mmetsp:Transcript_32925/g.102084  ORF Transcript_32925/g.102084 Transcript_32925/m.102084 type:complete len:221 (+) Transcript_32925:1111-1773(+)
MIQLLLDLVRGRARRRVVRDEPGDDRLQLVLHHLPDGGASLCLCPARPRRNLGLAELEEGLGEELLVGLRPERLRPVLPDEVLQVPIRISALGRLHCGLQVILQVSQPRRLVDRELHEGVLEALGALLVHLLQGPEHHGQVLVEEALRPVRLLDAGVVLVLADAGLLLRAVARTPSFRRSAVRMPKPWRHSWATPSASRHREPYLLPSFSCWWRQFSQYL